MYCSPSRTILNCFCAIPTDSNLCISEQYQQAAIYFWAVPASNNIFLYNTNRHQSISVQYQQTAIYFWAVPTSSNLFLCNTNRQQSMQLLSQPWQGILKTVKPFRNPDFVQYFAALTVLYTSSQTPHQACSDPFYNPDSECYNTGSSTTKIPHVATFPAIQTLHETIITSSQTLHLETQTPLVAKPSTSRLRTLHNFPQPRLHMLQPCLHHRLLM